jgi:transposase
VRSSSRPDELVCREGPPLGRRRERGEQSQAIGRSRGGRSTKIHALTDRYCRPIAFLLTGGQVADCKAAAALLEHLPPEARVLHCDKGYDTNPVRQQVEANGTLPNIPPKANRIWKSCFSPILYRARNAIKRMFCRLKDAAALRPATTGSPLPRRRLPRCHHQLLVMRPDPNWS